MRLQPHHKDQIGPTLDQGQFGAKHLGKTEYVRSIPDGEGWLILVVNFDGSRHMYRSIDLKHFSPVSVDNRREEERK